MAGGQQQKPEQGAAGLFGRFNALVEQGWLQVLSGIELALWMSYEKYADRDGIAYPDGQALARHMGYTTQSHIGPIRRSLEGHGLLEIIESGGGRGRRCRVRMLIPQAVPKQLIDAKPSHMREGIDPDYSAENAGNLPISGRFVTAETFPNPGVNLPVSGDKPSRLGGLHNKEEQPIEHPKEQTNAPIAAQSSREVVSSTNGEGRGNHGPLPDPEQPQTRKGRPGKFPNGVWQRACDGWNRAYAFVHGCKFRWDSRQSRGLRDVLDAIDADLEHFERVAKAWLREPEVGKAKGHPLYQLAEDLNYIESKIAKGIVGHGTAKPTAVERGEHPEPKPVLPARRLSAIASSGASNGSA